MIFYNYYFEKKCTKIGWWLMNRVARNIYNFARINKESSVLEIGPGRGQFANLCRQKEVEYQAIEPCKEMAESLGAIQAIVPPIPDTGRNWDFVVMSNVFEHMNSMKDALAVSEDAYKILNHKGRFVIYSPDYINHGVLFYGHDFTHNYITTLLRLRGLLHSAGFEKVEGRYQSVFFKGGLCVLVSALIRLLPFGRLYMAFPNRVTAILCRLQTPFLRCILIYGEKQ